MIASFSASQLKTSIKLESLPFALPKFYVDLLRSLDDVLQTDWEADPDLCLINICRWLQGDFGQYSSEFRLGAWESYEAVMEFARQPLYSENAFLTRGMWAFMKASRFLEDDFGRSGAVDQNRLLFWMIQWGARESPFALLNRSTNDRLFQCNDDELILSWMSVLRSCRSDLAALSIEKQLDWWQEFGRFEFTIRDMMYSSAEKFRLENSVEPSHALSHAKSDVLIGGYFSSMTGLGEDARMALKCSERAGLSTSALDLKNISDLASASKVSLFTVPATDLHKAILRTGSSRFGDSFRIGAWQWELSRWPTNYLELPHSVDEIWAISRYVEEIFLKSTNKPVVYVPLAVDVPVIDSRYNRAHFGLHHDEFVFLVLFDSKSSLRRKNPLTAVRAFYQAFSNQRDVRLVIKTMSADMTHPEWQEILRLVDGDERVTIIDRGFSDAEKIALMNACDALISVHRAEGFGRVIAEAMLLKKPVIVSNYSGNLTFNDSRNSYLVEGRIVPLEAGDYWSTEDQVWFEPSVSATAEKLVACVSDSERRILIAQRGFDTISTHHSVDAVSRIFADKLKPRL